MQLREVEVYWHLFRQSDDVQRAPPISPPPRLYKRTREQKKSQEGSKTQLLGNEGSREDS